MTNFILNKDNFIEECISDDEIIIIPEYIKGILSYAFTELPVKKIKFLGNELKIKESSFIGLKNLEVIDISNMDSVDFCYFEKIFVGMPLDICFIVKKENHRKLIEAFNDCCPCFLRKEVFDIDLGYDNPVWLNDIYWENNQSPISFEDYDSFKKLKVNFSCAKFLENIEGIYIPDMIDNKFVKMVDNDFHNLTNIFPNLKNMKLPKLDLFNYSYYFRNLSRVHLSRNDTTIYDDSFNNTSLESIYIPRNYEKVSGFQNNYKLQNIYFEDKNSCMIYPPFANKSIYYYNNLNMIYLRTLR